MYKRFVETIERHQLFSPGDAVLVGVSGGVDSVVLFHLLLKLRKEWGISVSMAHVNYGLRGKDSDDDEAFVKKLAEKNGAELFYRRASLDLDRENLQLEARSFRLNFFNEIIVSKGLCGVALAQHRDDQVETVLQHLVRGAGLQGLKGMDFISDHKGMKILRPLLHFKRDELTNFANSEGIKWREDMTNQKALYSRNFFRLKLIPVLREINPRADDAIFDLSNAAREDDEALLFFAKDFAQRNFKHEGDEITLSRKAFLGLSRSLRVRVIFLLYERLVGNREGLLSDHVNRMDEIARYETHGKSYSLHGGVKWLARGDELALVKENLQKTNQ